jgi:hypothetical protein
VALSFAYVGTSLGIELDRADMGAIRAHHDDATSTFGAAEPMAALGIFVARPVALVE